jgi:hypothetical protein
VFPGQSRQEKRKEMARKKTAKTAFDIKQKNSQFLALTLLFERYDIHHNDIQHNDIQHTNTRHNDTRHNDIQHNDTQHNDIQHNDTRHIDTQQD